MREIYFKSLTGTGESVPLETSTFVPKRQIKETCQYLPEILESGTIKPNTYHNVLGMRLCTSIPTKGYSGSFRPEGILFKTDQSPDYCCPVDLLALTDGNSLDASNHNANFLDGSSQMIFDNAEDMFKKYGTKKVGPNRDLVDLNKIREESSLSPVAKLFSYNECGFYTPVSIRPVGLVGTSTEIHRLAQKYNLVVYENIKDFVESIDCKEENKNGK